MEKLIKILQMKNLTISSAESFTGGLFSSLLTDVENASKVYLGSFITYSNQTKLEMLKIKQRIIKKYGVVSKECAYAMAQNVRKLVHTSIGVSFTGNAGPGSLENKTVGLAYLGISFEHQTYTFEINAPNLSRSEFKQLAITTIQQELMKLLK